MENVKPPVIVITGPTASGKTAISIELCKLIGGEVVCVDSMQVYRGMDIGTAKPTMAERQGILHHMLDVFSPQTYVTASDFGKMAKNAIAQLHAKGIPPVLCGGTGLYIDAITRPMRFSAPGDEALREELRDIAHAENGLHRLYAMLSACDPEAAAKYHPNDVRRVIRAIESYRLTGKTLSEHAMEDARAEGEYREILFAPEWSREVLYERINRRVDEMLALGLLAEVQQLLREGLSPESTAMQGIGYKEIYLALQGRMDMADAVAQIKQATRNYAKRQCTWLRRDGRIRFLPTDGKSAYDMAVSIVEICSREGYL